MDPKTSVSVALVCYNEVEIIEEVIRAFHAKIIQKVPGSELIIAEDGSTDGTKDVLKKLSGELNGIIWDEGKKGRGYIGAYRHAVEIAKNELVLFCDASGKHEPDDFFRMLPLMEGADLVVGYKESRADPFYRVIMSRTFNFMVNRYFHVTFHDINCPLRLFRKSAFLKVASENWISKAIVNFEVTLRFVNLGFKVKEITIHHFPRTNGDSRGLPFKTLPKTVLNVLKMMPRLKKELFNLRSS